MADPFYRRKITKPKRSNQQDAAVAAVRYNTPTIQPGEVTIEKSIGKGSFGEVYKGKCRGQTVAVKILTKQQLPEATLREFEREVTLISKYTHPNIVQFMGACYIPERMMLVTEFIPRGDLEDMLADPNINLSMPTRMKMAKGAALGMNWLHKSEHTFIHRDLKTKNLLVGEGNIIKLCDFGLSQVKPTPNALLKDPPNGAKGTPIWMAPEVLMNRPFDEKCDVYSFGLILWCLLTRAQPYEEYEELDVFRNDVCRKGIRPPIPGDCLPSLQELIQRCWSGEPAARPTFEEIIRQLEYIIIDYSIFDYAGRKIWVRNFLGAEKVLWDDFIDAFRKEVEDSCTISLTHYSPETLRKVSDYQLEMILATSSRDIQRLVDAEFNRRYPNGKPNVIQLEEERETRFTECLKALLVQKSTEDGVASEEIVTMEKFGEILNWFGPLIDQTAMQARIYDNVLDCLRQVWFHGDIDQTTAEDRIRGNLTGTFLVRFSSRAGYFTISQSTETKIEHRRFSYSTTTGVFRFNENIRAPTLSGLIALLANPLQLKYPCSGSRFTKFFENQTVGGYKQTGGAYLSSNTMDL